jgi:hypothetical protein
MKELRQVGFRKCLPAGGTKRSVLLLLHVLRVLVRIFGLTERSNLREGGLVITVCNGRWEIQSFVGKYRKRETTCDI